MRRTSQIWWASACLLALVLVCASFTLPRGFALVTLSDLVQGLLLLSATAIYFLNFLRCRGRPRIFWSLMTLGGACWLAYQLLWTYFEVYRRADVPNPFAGDVVLFLHIVPMMAAVALRPHLQQDDRRARLGTLDFTLLFVWWLYLYLFVVIPWQYAAVNEAAYGRALNVLYLAEKAAFLAVLASAWHTSQGIWRSIYAHLFGASLFYAFSSYLANWAIQRNVYFSGSLYDLPLVASLAWMTYVGLVAREGQPEARRQPRSEGTGVWIARLGMIAVFSLPLFAVSTVFDARAPQAVRTFRLVVTLGCMLVMGILVFTKQHILDRELLRLLRTSQESFENLKRLQTQLVQSEKLASLGQLVGGAAHELNNPLTAMMGYSDLLSATPLNREQHVLAEKIGVQVRRTKTLIANLLSFARQTPGEKSHVDLNTLVQTAIKLSQPQLHAGQVQVESAFAPGLPRIFGDSNQLLQVCLQIINNAVFAMEGGGILAVSTRLKDDLVQVEFRDHGPGIQDPEKVFDPFYTTRPVGHGSGLGLSACYGIIQEHSGKITCENASQGGAIFRIELPAHGSGKPPVAKAGFANGML
ncbi:MAG: hypothetical protein JST79_08190 [Acidobacteria bacterium]|nr:hypothetical protein [Acidobacteriota bacterium]